MRATVVILTKLSEQLPVKTRLWSFLGRERAIAAYRHMLAETLATARRLSAREPVLAHSPADADPEPSLPGLAGYRALGVDGRDGADCLERAIAAADEGLPLLVLGGDAPDLPEGRLRRALAALERHHAAVVPSLDGGFAALALRAPVPGLAGAFRFGSEDAASQLEAFLSSGCRTVARLGPWPDVDTPEDWLAYLARRGGGGRAHLRPVRSGSACSSGDTRGAVR
ncbi:MAG: DUF2064 domain-containing protein [Proteobacteria bacterium]|nr:DUF2064 domain-containing protein [Pseudomonadota bacterium]